jgi:hypothetical protein
MVLKIMSPFVQDNEEAILLNFSLKILDASVHITISNDPSLDDGRYLSDMVIHTDGPAPWGKEETGGGRLVSYYSTEISLAQEMDFKNRVDHSQYELPSVHPWK